MTIREAFRNSQRLAVARFSDLDELEQKYVVWYFLNRFGSLGRFYFQSMRKNGGKCSHCHQPMFFDGYKHTCDLGFSRKGSWPLCVQIQTRKFAAICKQKAVLAENMDKVLNTILKRVLVEVPLRQETTRHTSHFIESMGQSDISCILDQ